MTELVKTVQNIKRQINVRENGQYALLDGTRKSSCIQPVSKLETQVRLGQCRKDKERDRDRDRVLGEGEETLHGAAGAEAFPYEEYRGICVDGSPSATCLTPLTPNLRRCTGKAWYKKYHFPNTGCSHP